MADTIHTKRLNPTHIRELSVYYDKGGVSMFSYRQKPKGIYLRSTVSEHTEGSNWKTWRMDQPTDGYLLVTPLERYKPTALKSVTERVASHPDVVHGLLEAGKVEALLAFLRCEINATIARSALETREVAA
jgi:hypothetical protein